MFRLGIGDVTEPLPLACREAMQMANEEMGTGHGFRGYGPEDSDAVAKIQEEKSGIQLRLHN